MSARTKYVTHIIQKGNYHCHYHNYVLFIDIIDVAENNECHTIVSFSDL